MEQHIPIQNIPEELKPSDRDDAQEWFLKANRFCELYYRREIRRASSVIFSEVSADLFFSEYIWVVHATGFSAKAVSKFIPHLSGAYGPYESLAQMTKEDMWAKVLPICNNKQKSLSVWKTAKMLDENIKKIGWNRYRDSELYPVDKLPKLPYIGNVTKYHLGRNIGILDCVKPDLHLNRMAKHWGYSDAKSMIEHMNEFHSYPLGIADMIAWYYASTFGTSHMRKEGDR